MTDTPKAPSGLALPAVPNLDAYLRALLQASTDSGIASPELDLNDDGTAELSMIVTQQIDADTVRALVGAVADAASPYQRFLDAYRAQNAPAGEPTSPVPVQAPAEQ